MLWRRWRVNRKGDLKEPEEEVLLRMPADVSHALQQSPRKEPVVKHVVLSAVTRFVTDIDKRTLEVLTAKIVAGTAAVKAATEARRAVHELLRVDQELDQRADLSDLRHETARLAEQDKQEMLRLRGTRRQHAAATLKAQRAWLERELDGADSPKAQATNKWEALLQAFRGDVTGITHFQSQTSQWLDEYRERQRAGVHEDDPRRAEKLARIDVLVDELQALRDRMLRESWGPSGSGRNSTP
jgi:hypothetical protein